MTSYQTDTATQDGSRGTRSRSEARPTVVHHNYTETKLAWLTTEFWAYLATVAAVVVAAVMADSNDTGALGTDRAVLYVSLLTIGYMVARGLAKSGSREPRDDS